jgi:LytS/YehU family sensor histidine kinase
VQVARFLVSYRMQMEALESQAHALSRAELKALEAQVHPHFLFNALTTIAGLCEVNPRQASALIVKLGEFFRSSLRSERGYLSNLQEELALVASYLEIELARFGERLTVNTEVDEGALGCEIPSFSLQPLVENAVLHGASKKAGPVSIRIVVRLKGDRLICWVIDTGRGFDAETVDFTRGESHALPMLYGRLRNIYGTRFALRVRSRPGRGTVICLWVPAMENQDKCSEL